MRNKLNYIKLYTKIFRVLQYWKQEINLTDTLIKVESGANTGGDILTTSHVRNWMECIRSRKQPNAPVEAGYYHSIANIMTNAAVRTGFKATFDEAKQEVIVDGKVFKYWVAVNFLKIKNLNFH